MKHDLTEIFAQMHNDRRAAHYCAGFNMSLQDIRNLQDKNILVIGGGASKLVRDFADFGIRFSITNIDPYVTGHDPENETILLKRNFLGTKFKNKFDEVWSFYALPEYAKFEFEVILTFACALRAAKPSGVVRISRKNAQTPNLFPYKIDWNKVQCSFINTFNHVFIDSKIEDHTFPLIVPTGNGRADPNLSIQEYLDKRNLILSRPELSMGFMDSNIYFKVPENKRFLNIWLKAIKLSTKLKNWQNYYKFSR
ncbi:MAG: hypothetical protein LBK26_02815 [Rickettsiales bacterium]|jgi:hypothetical protein|nr:hypothetical protein [Rickettsiales bacterium]